MIDALIKSFSSAKEESKLPNNFNNPFSNKNVKDIRIFTSKWVGKNSNPGWKGNIEFEKGNTEGKQNFEVEGLENLGSLLKQMEDFLKLI